MASWMIHFRIADGIIDSIKNIDTEKFIVGNIAPDCGELCKDGKTYRPLKYITHWENPKNKKESLKDEFFIKYVAGSNMSSEKYLNYFSDFAFESKITEICNVYNTISNNLDREYPYLKKEQADTFVKKAIEVIKNDLIIKSII